MLVADRITPALCHQRLERGAALRLDQCLLVPRSRRIDIELGGRDVVVAGQHHGNVLLDEFRGMRSQPPEPCELGVEFRTRLRIAVRQINAGDNNAFDGGFDVARLAIIRVTGQFGPDQHRLGLARQDGDAVPGLLAAPDRAVAGLVDGAKRKVIFGRLQFLKANDIGFCLSQPTKQVRQAPVDIVDVERGDLHALIGPSGRYRGWLFGRYWRGLFGSRRAALVDPRVTRPEAVHNFVADGAEVVRQIVDGDALANQRHHMAAPRGVLVEVGDVDGHQVHRDAAGHRAALTRNHYVCGAGAVDAAGSAEIAVGIAGRNDRQPSRPARRPGAAVADAFAFVEIADLHNAGLQLDHRLHRIVGFRRRIDAVERGTGTYQVKLERLAQKDARGIRQRGRHAGKKTGNLAEAGELLGVERMVEALGAGEVAHEQRDGMVAGIDPGDDTLRLRDGEAQPVHAGVDVNGSTPGPAGAPAKHVPFGQLVEIADHGFGVDLG